MNRINRRWAASAAALLIAVAATVPAEATADHTYVSGKGTDTGGCIDQATACRSFSYAIKQTAPGGEIIAIDGADYGPVLITQSISIVANAGGPAGIVVNSSTPLFSGFSIPIGIAVQAGSSDIVNLRGLTIDGEGTIADGIFVNAAGSVTITDCVVRHFVDDGIAIGAPKALILNSVMTNNGEAGLAVGGPAKATYVVRNSVVNNNFIGVGVADGATITFADSMITDNSQDGIFVSTPSTLLSYGDNEINGNGTNVFQGTLTPVAKQ